MSNYTFHLTLNVLNTVSLLAAVAVVVMIAGAKLVDKRSVDHVTIRITLAISILDIMAYITHVCKASLDLQDTPYFASQSLQHWLLLSYLFLNMSIAVNLQLVYVHECEFNPMWERLYWITSFVLATVSVLATPAVCLFGDEEMHICLEGESNNILLFEMSLYSFWILVPLIYSSVAIAFVICKLARHKRFLRSLRHSPAGANTSFITTLMFRVIIPTFTKGGLLLLYTFEVITGQHAPILSNTAHIMSALSGILSYLAFLIDPGFKKAFQALKKCKSRLASNSNLCVYLQPPRSSQSGVSLDRSESTIHMAHTCPSEENHA